MLWPIERLLPSLYEQGVFALKPHKVISRTGIFERTSITFYQQGATAEERADFFQQLPREEPRCLETELDRCESEALNYLREYIQTDLRDYVSTDSLDSSNRWIGFELVGDLFDVREKIVLQEDRRDRARKLIRLEKARDACEILFYVEMIQNRLKEGFVDPSLFLLGRVKKQFEVRESELAAWRGGKTLRGARAGGEARGKSPEYYQRLFQEFKKSRLSERAFARKKGISRSALQWACEKVGSLPAK
jgi:hypothetical protein